MGSSNAVFTDDSATISDDGTETDMDMAVESRDDYVESPPPSDSSPFQEGEKVLAYHSQHLYPAKGWNKNWDEWVGIDRLLKCTEENAKKQEVLDKNHGPEKNVKPALTRGKKRKNEPVPKKGTAELEQLMPIQIPSTLKKQLVDDCESITHMGKLVKLPRTPNVDEILKMYVEYQLKMDGWPNVAAPFYWPKAELSDIFDCESVNI
ncbi:hypothetical protein RJ639_013310 [Escallonia herrerae]|uniref:MRG domain-containing protein n=1 Tax=Escallonia herrerae TaxID=1293975 RepID=A0AA88VF58_9ASTE|nr:hypothetical protein RJ639_013310 [Escallonia herrerae]